MKFVRIEFEVGPKDFTKLQMLRSYLRGLGVKFKWVEVDEEAAD